MYSAVRNREALGFYGSGARSHDHDENGDGLGFRVHPKLNAYAVDEDIDDEDECSS